MTGAVLIFKDFVTREYILCLLCELTKLLIEKGRTDSENPGY